MSNESGAVESVKNRGWSVTFAGMGINLALGILYTWSVMSKAIPDSWGWSETHKSLPYSIACLVFCLVMVPAGRMQDKLTPSLTARIGGVLVGLGMIIASFTTGTASLFGYVLGFGLLAGAGIGFGYAAATPPAVKWFPAAKTGMIAGLVVSGFGLASVYTAPVTQALINRFELPMTMRIWGIAFFFAIMILSFLLIAPPAGFKAVAANASGAAAKTPPKADHDSAPSEMLRTWQFYLLWFLYACGAGAGLMIISKLATIAFTQAGIEWAFVLVAALAIGNGGGRVAAGMLSDKIGRKNTMRLCFCLQAIMIFVLSLTQQGRFLATLPVLSLVSALIGANYGANLALFPAVTKDYYGLKNFGVNYGLIFTSWGVGGFMLSLYAGWVYDQSAKAGNPSFNFSYYAAIALLLVAAALTFVIKPPKRAS